MPSLESIQYELELNQFLRFHFCHHSFFINLVVFRSAGFSGRHVHTSQDILGIPKSHGAVAFVLSATAVFLQSGKSLDQLSS